MVKIFKREKVVSLTKRKHFMSKQRLVQNYNFNFRSLRLSQSNTAPIKHIAYIFPDFKST